MGHQQRLSWVMRLKIVVVCILCFGPQALAEDRPGLTTMVDAVLARNSGMKAAEAKVRQAEAGRRQATAMRFPMLSARSQFTRSDNPVYVFGTLMQQGHFGPQNFAIDSLNNPGPLTNIQSALDLGIPLFTGFELTSAARLSELSWHEASSGREGAAQQLRLQTASLFFQLLFYRDLLKNLDDRIVASGQEIADAGNLKARGVVLGSDYYAAEAIHSGLKGWKIQVQADQSTALARLAILSGKEGWQPTGSLTGKMPEVASKEDLMKTALIKRPELLAAESRVTMADVNRRQAGRALLPKIQAFASLATNTDDFSSNPSNYLFGVGATFPLGDPAYFARRSGSLAAEEAAAESRTQLEESIRIEVSQAYEAYQGARAGLSLAKDTQERAAKSLELFRPLYRSGRQSILEVLRAEEASARTQATYLQALLNIHVDYLQLQAAAGCLDQTVITQLSRQSMETP